MALNTLIDNFLKINWHSSLDYFIANDVLIRQLQDKVIAEYYTHKCYPKFTDIFRAFILTPFDKVKVVIIGQDPYHTGVADGLAFSAKDAKETPKSLENILIEVKNNYPKSTTGNNLEEWAKQGVLLLNSTLTVRAYRANSHVNLGWVYFTNVIIKFISDNKSNVVFIMWGLKAQEKKQFINANKHLILTSSHPSPLAVMQKNSTFFNANHFIKANNYLNQHKMKTINF